MQETNIKYRKYSLQTLMKDVDKVEIPVIQRDYAFGRKNDEIKKKCERFITNLSNFEENAITLDIIYGNIEDRVIDRINECVFIPLDGQQRLTTLFLLYYFAKVKDNIEEKEYDFLKKFTYNTRLDSKDFCEELIKYPLTLENDKNIKDIISDQKWFQLCWETDPTINSMLNVLNCIQRKFKNIDKLWKKLNPENPEKAPIQFYYLDLESAGLNDELYIKMNSTGKQLTLFENFKVELEQRFIDNDKKIAENLDVSENIPLLIDTEWTDLLWHYRKDENDSIVPVDSRFLNYFKFIFGIMCLKNAELPLTNSDDYSLFDEYLDKFFPKDDYNKTINNIQELKKYFDCWTKLKQDDRWEKSATPNEFFEKILSNEHSLEKVKIKDNIDLLETCVTDYDKSTFNQRLYLYTVISYLANEKDLDKEHFLKKFRCIRNLIENSSDRLAYRKDETNRLKRIIEQIDLFMENDKEEFKEKDDEGKDFSTFNEHQIGEEKLKFEWIKNKDIANINTLYKLEDHDVLRGQIGIIGLDNINEERYESFNKLFDESDKNKIARALMTIDDYSMNRYEKYRVPNKDESSWREFFHKATNKNAWGDSENNRKTLNITLNELLDKLKTKTLDKIIAEYPDTEKDWRYYYIKYPEAFDTPRGYYHYDYRDGYPYRCMALNETIRSPKSWQPLLKAVVLEHHKEIQDESWRDYMEGTGAGLDKIKCKYKGNNLTLQFEWASDDESGEDKIKVGNDLFEFNSNEDVVNEINNIIASNNIII